MTAATDITTSTETALSVDGTNNKQRSKRLICIRHARSKGNEFMERPGNRWGDATFCDDATMIDVRLSETGMQQVREELLPQFLPSNPQQQSFVVNGETTTTTMTNNNNSNVGKYAPLLQEVDLVIVSPLTRTQETFQYGVLPALQKLRPDRLPHIVAHPWSTERVYTASDTGRSVTELAKEFPWVDWSLLLEYNNENNNHKKEWWYSHTNNETAAATYQEWRPYGEGQWYAVPGEPMEDFLHRMKQLEDWIAAREETTILLVAHWGVLKYLTGDETANCEVKVLKDWKPLHQQQGQQQELEG